MMIIILQRLFRWARAHPRLVMALALITLLVAVLAFIDYQERQIRRLRLDRANVLAALDSTRDVTAQLENAIEEDQQVKQRQAVQQEAERDAIDRALAQERKFSGQLMVHLQQLSAAFPSEVHRDSGGVALVDLAYRVQGSDSTLGYIMGGTVAVPEAGPAQVSLTVDLDPITYGIRVGCGQAIEGIRPAQVTVTGPRAANLVLGQQQIDPDVCNARRNGVVVGASSCALKALRCPAVSPLYDVRTGRLAASATVELTSWLRPGILYTTGN